MTQPLPEVSEFERLLTELKNSVQDKIRENNELILQFIEYFQVEENRVIVATIESINDKLRPYFLHLDSLEKKAGEHEVDIGSCIKNGMERYNQLKEDILQSVKTKLHEGVENVGSIVDKYQSESTVGLQNLLSDLEDVSSKLKAMDADKIQKAMPEINRKISEVPIQMDSNFRAMMEKIQKIGEDVGEHLDERFQNTEVQIGIVQAESQLCVYKLIQTKLNSKKGAIKKE